MKLLTRDQFRTETFERDSYKCVICGELAKDAHHILERRLFSDGGYYIDNGASLCEKHHIEAEKTILSANELRDIIGISKIVLPEHLYTDQNYDKWGNIILENGQRIAGELFNDESVQKILKEGDVLKLFLNYVKYPRTYHLPWSEGKTKDDKSLINCSFFIGKRVVVSLKMDGENTTMYSNYIHARSIDSNNHPSRNFVKKIHGTIMGDIPEGWRVCGENLYAKHSIFYHDLQSYFYIFSIWNDKNQCLSWDETVEWSNLLDLPVVPVLYDGIYDELIIKKLFKNEYNGNEMEGYVMRLADSFNYKDFKSNVAKYVRTNHVHTHGHWMRSKIVPNKLKN